MRAVLLAVILTASLTSTVDGHVVLDPAGAEALLAEVAVHRRASLEAPADSGRVEALFRLGETVETIVEALNRDVSAHGQRDLFGELLVTRLQAHTINVGWVARDGRYEYDLAAFREYLRRAPRGRWAPEARFRLLARRFYATLGTDPATLVGIDVAGVLDAVRDEARFLRDYPTHERATTVRFFLAVDHYRIARNTRDPARVREHERHARRALQQTVDVSAEAFEVRAAQTLLERLAAGPVTPR
jgi:hypothetical protein